MAMYLSLVVAVAGLVMFLMRNPLVRETGRIMFAVGLLVFLLLWPHLVPHAR